MLRARRNEQRKRDECEEDPPESTSHLVSNSSRFEGFSVVKVTGVHMVCDLKYDKHNNHCFVIIIDFHSMFGRFWRKEKCQLLVGGRGTVH